MIGEKKLEGMVSKFGIEHLWLQGDEIIRGIAIVLLLMSIASWIVILIKLIEIGRVKLQNRRVDVFWHSEDVIEGIEKLGNENDNPFAMIARNAHIAANHLQGDNSADNKKNQLHDKLDPSEWIGRAINQAIDRSVFKLQSGLWILASVASTAPFVGLFGTVWSIYHALMNISTNGSASLDQVAGPIGEALIMTALGLAVAIPAALGYNAIVRGQKIAIHMINRFAHEIHSYYLSGMRWKK